MHLIALCASWFLLNRKTVTKTLLIMNFTAFLVCTACLHVSAKGLAQITLKEKNIPLSAVFKKIQSQSGYDIIYSYELIKPKR